MADDPLLESSRAHAESALQPPLSVQRGALLLYAITVNNHLKVTVDPRSPVKNRSAFQTDLCIFEERSEAVRLPRVVIEFKSKITTHDILTYSAKARKHKQIYPYLRYGLVMAAMKTIPGRVFLHNEALDFALAAETLLPNGYPKALMKVIEREVDVSKRLEEIAFSKPNATAFFTDVRIDRLDG